MGSDQQADRRSPDSWDTRLIIDGERVAGDGPTIVVDDPATEQAIAHVRGASAEQVEAAVTSSAKALAGSNWRKDPERRKKVLLRFADLIEENRSNLESTLVQEVGTPVVLCGPIHLGASIEMIRHFAELATIDRTRDFGRDTRAPESASIVRYEAAGVVAGIGAYNYPLVFLASKAAAALAAGCSIVYMPSPQTPLATLMCGQLALEAGVPAGILNMIVGDAEAARALTLHEDVARVSFTGSIDVGRKVMEQAAQGLKGVVLELGGKSPGIVLPGADPGEVAMPLHGRYLRNAGQGCQSPTRLLIPEEMFDDFVDASRDAYAQIKVGDPWDQTTVAGPLISAAHRQTVEGYVERAVAGGGEVLVGGGRPEELDRGWYMNSTLVGRVGNRSEISREELFGPVASLMTYKSIDELVELSNDSVYGLAASIFGPIDLAKDVATRLQAGTVYINGGGQLRVDTVLAAWKMSGVGAEWGEDGLREFLEPQHIQWAV